MLDSEAELILDAEHGSYSFDAAIGKRDRNARRIHHRICWDDACYPIPLFDGLQTKHSCSSVLTHSRLLTCFAFTCSDPLLAFPHSGEMQAKSCPRMERCQQTVHARQEMRLQAFASNMRIHANELAELFVEPVSADIPEPSSP